MSESVILQLIDLAKTAVICSTISYVVCRVTAQDMKLKFHAKWRKLKSEIKVG